MSRSYKKQDPRKRSYPVGVCPRHGYCSWCDRNRQHQKLKSDEGSKQDLDTYNDDKVWYDDDY